MHSYILYFKYLYAMPVKVSNAYPPICNKDVQRHLHYQHLINMPSNSPILTSELTFSKARLFDVPAIKDLITPYANADVMLHRSSSELFENIREYIVCRVSDNIVGCGSLHIASLELAEIRALAVKRAWQNQGIGRKIVELCIAEASGLGLKRLFTLTLEPEFFSRAGFTEIAREKLTSKVWQECYRCPKFDHCDEIAMILDL